MTCQYSTCSVANTQTQWIEESSIKTTLWPPGPMPGASVAELYLMRQYIKKN